ncbi:MAG: cell division protein ZapA [Ruminococcaceae bacterium]|nr:cell division protein ZapA [Oscillospiraceae bacterium]
MIMKERYEVSIAGTEMVLISEENEEYVKNLAQILDRRVMDMVIVKNRCTKIEALTLCAMDYLDATVKLKAELEELKTKYGIN